MFAVRYNLASDPAPANSLHTLPLQKTTRE
jgi:hypothetical protein